ncbi:flagellar protein FlbT [Devosia enhydra]|uniref:Flagellar protein FlbT n=1 Tax=Devosia enhydra TaxID=665118 RepID=A0A1K2HU36_9HYPH|nr:flagellar biosynthesis repressor FlbT [Devosia enhydra]SFZ81484.1 flagellar protein FlbT [Devosia enhydra]
MALKVELRPGERLIVGNCVITNSDQRTRLFIEGRTPILREKDILSPATADTPAKRIYLAIQLMYLGDESAALRRQYFELVTDLVRAAPSTTTLVDEINNEILTNSHYKALKAAKKLVAYEQDLLSNAASGSAGLSAGGEADR